MPAFDAGGKQVSCNRRRWMESRIAFGIAGPGDRALGLCIGNFAEHALRRCGDLAWLGAAGRHNFVCFRRWLPLLGMALCLLLSCLVALTLGQLLFGRLSMISVGFCAILVGLGVDFAILTIGRYHQARSDGEPHPQAIATSIAKLGRAVFFG